jgi:hypothetical protein
MTNHWKAFNNFNTIYFRWHFATNNKLVWSLLYFDSKIKLTLIIVKMWIYVVSLIKSLFCHISVLVCFCVMGLIFFSWLMFCKVDCPWLTMCILRNTNRLAWPHTRSNKRKYLTTTLMNCWKSRNLKWIKHSVKINCDQLLLTNSY